MLSRHSRIEPPIDQTTIDDYWLALYRQRWIVITVMVASAVLAWFLSGRITPRYEATAAFYVPGDVIRPGDGGLDESRARLPGTGLGEAKGFASLLEGGDATRAIAAYFKDRQITPDVLYRDVDLIVSRQGVINVYVRNTDPELAAQIANRYVWYFNEFHTRIVRDGLAHTLDGIEKERGAVISRKEQREQALQEFEQKNQIASLEDEVKELEAKRNRYEDRIKEADAAVIAAQQRVDVLSKQLSEEDDAYRQDKVVLDSPLIDQLRQTMVQAEIDLAQKEVALTPKHPDVLALQARVDKARQSLRDEMQRIVEGTTKQGDTRHEKLRSELTDAQVEFAVATAKAESARAGDQTFQERAKQIPAILRERNQLKEQIERDRTRLASLDKSYDDAQMDLMRTRDAIVITQQATAPPLDHPVYPIPILNTAVAGFGGLVVGVLYALLLNHIDESSRQRRMRRLAISAWISKLMPPANPRTVDRPPRAGVSGNGHSNGNGNGHSNGNGNGNGNGHVKSDGNGNIEDAADGAAETPAGGKP
jgi:uncharacterized protein involved in exopolysaccharide biosynthesis